MWCHPEQEWSRSTVWHCFLQVIVHSDAPRQGTASCVGSTVVQSLSGGDAGHSAVVLDCRISWLGVREISALGNTGLACLLVVHLEICSLVLVRTLEGLLRAAAAVCATLPDLALVYSRLGSSHRGVWCCGICDKSSAFGGCGLHKNFEE